MFGKGTIVRSVAGHDKDRFYLVVDVKENDYYIADGKLRTLEKPKKKNEKHLAKTNMMLDIETISTNKELRRLLSSYNNLKIPKGGNLLV